MPVGGDFPALSINQRRLEGGAAIATAKKSLLSSLPVYIVYGLTTNFLFQL